MSSSNTLRARREAISQALNLKDLAEELAGVRWRGNTCSCCFHGRDSRPSMYYYPSSNRIHCFGCPPGEQTYDVVWFVKQLNGWNLLQTLAWLEKEYGVHAPAAVNAEEDDEPQALSWRQLSDCFLREAHTLAMTVEERIAIRQRYWGALQQGDKMVLARLLGRERIEALKAEVFGVDGDEGVE